MGLVSQPLSLFFGVSVGQGNFKKEVQTLGLRYNKIILDECSTVVEIDHVRNRKPA